MPHSSFLPRPCGECAARPGYRQHLDPPGRKLVYFRLTANRPLLRQRPAPGLDIPDHEGSRLSRQPWPNTVGGRPATDPPSIFPSKCIPRPTPRSSLPIRMTGPMPGCCSATSPCSATPRIKQKRPDAQPRADRTGLGRRGIAERLARPHRANPGARLGQSDHRTPRPLRCCMNGPGACRSVTIGQFETDALPALTVGLGQSSPPICRPGCRSALARA